ncbi:MAG: two-component regulator propeller domain-containing protein [Polaribacter sp.]|nr:two-component regulator propeller domain-containing protein [Polaribacter sp.]MDG2074340.1 two-component regulator propeller domain-containing protein [Polaribacter sp.]
MKKNVLFFLLLIPFFSFSQTDYSNRWEDFYSYNNVKDFITINDKIYALTDNAVFIYDTNSEEIQKLSSINGLSGETTSAIHYNITNERLIIGYETGLIEVLNKDGSIKISADIVNFNQSGEKRINQITEFNNLLYISTPFAVVVYDVDKLEFGDTYFIGANSTSVKINQTLITGNQIYAATENGIYVASLANPNLIDFNNWQLTFAGNYTNITRFNAKIYASRGNDLVNINVTNLTVVKTFPNAIKKLKTSGQNLTVTSQLAAAVLNTNLTQVYQISPTVNYNFTLNNASTFGNELFLATNEFGILQVPVSGNQNFTEIHPKGPLSNSVFSMDALNKNIWFVYGGYNSAYVPTGNLKGFSHYNGSEWKNTTFTNAVPVLDLVNVTIDPDHENRAFLSSYSDTNSGNVLSGGGLLEVVDDQILNFYNSRNSLLEDFFPNDPNRITTRINGTTFDNQGNLWVTDVLASNKLKKLTPSGSWQAFDLRSIQTNKAEELNTIKVDKANSLWIGTRRNGAYVFNERGSRKRALTTEPTKGSLPNANVRTIAVDKNNRIWLGTQSGLAVFYNANGLFEANIYDVEPIIILDDGIPKKLLGNQTVNSIVVDGADNKWFGTDNGGVLYTNPNGQNTIASFNKDNSPLPSNKILNISVDITNGKVYFATDKGVVAYKSNVASFGETLEAVYAYPNPALKKHQTVTIDGKNGNHLPKGTNVKILDVAGNLVYETNVVEGQEIQGGKVVWNKTNLAGKKVASGIYIVLLSNDDATETSTTKIAIIN